MRAGVQVHEMAEQDLLKLVEGLANGERVDGAAVIAVGDCLSLLRHIPDESVRLILTSPPYNVGLEYERVLPINAYVAWCRRWLSELARICAPDGSVLVNLGYLEAPGRGKAVPIAYLLWEHLELYLMQEIVWYFRAG